MEANKVTLTVTVEVLDIVSAKAQLIDVANQIDSEKYNGRLVQRDGDTVEWCTETEAVEI